MKAYNKRQEEITAQLAKLINSDENFYITMGYIFELARQAYNLFLSSEMEERRQIINLVFQNLSLNQGNLEYTMNKPFDSIFKTGGSLKWGGESRPF